MGRMSPGAVMAAPATLIAAVLAAAAITPSAASAADACPSAAMRPAADAPSLALTELTRRTLTYLDAHPGAANVDIAQAIDVRHESQMSRHLGRLERAGVVVRRRLGRANAWALTPLGRDAARAAHDLHHS